MSYLSIASFRGPLRLVLVVVTACATLSAQREWFGKQPADAEVVKLRPPLLDSMLEPIAVPGEGPLQGLAARGGELLVGRGDALIALEVGTGKVLRRGKAPRGLVALAADEAHLYALCGTRVSVLDAAKFEVERELLVLDQDATVGAPTAIAVCGDRLLLARGGRLAAIDARSGEVASLPDVRVEPGASLRWLQGSAVDEHLWGGDLRTVTKMTVAQPGRMADSWPLPADLRQVCGAVVSGRLVLGIDGLDDQGRPRQLVGHVRAPWRGDEELLTLKLSRGADDVVRYELGPLPLKDLPRLQRELRRIAADPACRVPVPGGGSRRIRALIEAQPGVNVRELLGAWDATSESGFEVLFAGAGGPAAGDRQVVEPPPPPPPPVRRDGK